MITGHDMFIYSNPGRTNGDTMDNITETVHIRATLSEVVAIAANNIQELASLNSVDVLLVCFDQGECENKDNPSQFILPIGLSLSLIVQGK